MSRVPIAEQPVEVPTTRRLRQPWPRSQESLRWSDDLERAAAALPEEVSNDVAQALITVMAARLVASAMDARLLADRTSPLQRFERRLRKSTDTFNRQFG